VPTYEYVCTECGQDLEVVQSFSDAALTECPSCSGRLRKRYSPVGVVFKGSGFYKTDSRQKPRKGSDETSKPAAAATGDGEATAGTAKSDAADGSVAVGKGAAGKGAGGKGAAGEGASGAAKGSGTAESGRAGQKAAASGERSGSDSGAGNGSRKPSSSAA